LKLRILWVGKTQQDWVKDGIGEYAARIKRYTSLEIVEVKEEKGAVSETMRARECDRLRKSLPKNAMVLLLDEKGETMSSPRLASFISGCRDTATSELAFVIGGAYGFTDEFKTEADKVISLSAMTFTHQMVRIFLLEQIYRGFTIINGEPYHH
jgi:23S rRNA (pseudouridine1915-N3)-methyltransferase